jgi:AAA family ATP:ADP antiporter
MLAAAPLYAWLYSRLSRSRLIHLIFHFFVVNILLFAVWFRVLGPEEQQWLSRILFIWVSVFSLFVTSVFWSVMTECFSNEQGKRLFGPIAAGATTGAILGSMVASLTAARLGVANLFIISATMLELSLLCAVYLLRSTRDWKTTQPPPSQERATILSGLREIIQSRYLILIAIYLAMISFCGTTNYLKLTAAAKVAILDSDQRTQFFANLNFYVQAGTLIAQTLLIGPLMNRLGLTAALLVLPMVYFVCFLLLGASETLWVLGTVDVLSRIGAYGITVPSREVLFTIVSRTAKYQSKNFIDTVVFRGADAIASLMSLATWAIVTIVVIWGLLAAWLGREYQQRVPTEPGSG